MSLDMYRQITNRYQEDLESLYGRFKIRYFASCPHCCSGELFFRVEYDSERSMMILTWPTSFSHESHVKFFGDAARCGLDYLSAFQAFGEMEPVDIKEMGTANVELVNGSDRAPDGGFAASTHNQVFVYSTIFETGVSQTMESLKEDAHSYLYGFEGNKVISSVLIINVKPKRGVRPNSTNFRDYFVHLSTWRRSDSGE